MIKVDVSQIPDEIGWQLGAAFARGLKEYLKQPGARERLEALTAERLARKAAVLQKRKPTTEYGGNAP